MKYSKVVVTTQDSEHEMHHVTVRSTDKTITFQHIHTEEKWEFNWNFVKFINYQR